MSFATGTATRTEAVTLRDACLKLTIALNQIADGSGNPTVAPGRFTLAEVDTLVSAVSAAITAVNA
jgi:hypothetical protein